MVARLVFPSPRMNSLILTGVLSAYSTISTVLRRRIPDNNHHAADYVCDYLPASPKPRVMRSPVPTLRKKSSFSSSFAASEIESTKSRFESASLIQERYAGKGQRAVRRGLRCSKRCSINCIKLAEVLEGFQAGRAISDVRV